MELPEQPPPERQTLQSRKEEWKFCDPESDVDRKGMLLSDQIDKFCKEGLLIATNYDRSRLRPAAYTLTIGNDYVDSSGKIGSLSSANPFLEIKENSIVYVTTAEQLDLPYYIVARFNLRVKWVYKGFLSCPLYNLTNRPIRTRLGDEFATIDFERTTNFCGGKKWSEIKAAIKKGEKLDEVTVDDRTYFLFKDKGYKPLQHLPDYDIVSSLVEMQKEVRNWRNIGIGLVIAFVSLALSIVGLQVRMEGNVISNAKDVSKVQAELQQARDKITSLQNFIGTSGPTPLNSSPLAPNQPAKAGRNKPGSNR